MEKYFLYKHIFRIILVQKQRVCVLCTATKYVILIKWIKFFRKISVGINLEFNQFKSIFLQIKAHTYTGKRDIM